ncbi:MAG: hypothetical protein WCL70_05530 [Paludibacter sp.]
MKTLIRNLSGIIVKYKTLTLYLNSTILLFIIGLVCSFISYRYITPQLLGIWTTLTTFEVYFSLIRLGIPNGMNRELPYALGTGESEKAMLYASTTFAYSLFCSLVLLLIAPILIFTTNFDISSRYYWLVFAVVIFRVISDPYTTYLSGTFRTNDNFDKLSEIQHIQSFIRLFSIIIVVFWHFEGYLLWQFIIAITNIIQLHQVRPFRIKPKFAWIAFKDLFNIGFPIFIISFIGGTIDTFPRLFLIKNASTFEMGLLSPIVLFLSAVALIPITIINYFTPKFSFDYGKYNDAFLLRKKMLYVFGISFIVSVFISIIVYFSIDYFILYFPKYIQSLSYIKLSCISVLFIGYKLGGALPVVLKKWKWLWAYTILYGIIQTSSLFFFNKIFNDKLQVVVYSLIITSLLLLLFSIIMTFSVTRKIEIEDV